MSKITPCLWIPVTPEEAVAYYNSIFANVTAEGLTPMTGVVTIEGQRFQLLNGGPTYKFNEAAGAIYEFTWGTFCDWYLELVKPLLNGEDEVAKVETRRNATRVHIDLAGVALVLPIERVLEVVT